MCASRLALLYYKWMKEKDVPRKSAAFELLTKQRQFVELLNSRPKYLSYNWEMGQWVVTASKPPNPLLSGYAASGAPLQTEPQALLKSVSDTSKLPLSDLFLSHKEDL